MKTPFPGILVEGDAYDSLFLLPASAGSPGSSTSTQIVRVPVGASYILDSINFLGASNVAQLIQTKTNGFPFKTSGLYVLHQLKIVKMRAKSGKEDEVEVLRATELDGQPVQLCLGVEVPSPAKPGVLTCNRSCADAPVLVHWFGLPTFTPRENWTSVGTITPLHYVQTGCPDHMFPLSQDFAQKFEGYVKPRQSKFVVMNIGEVCEEHRVRKAMSYEAIAVDLLRMWRGKASEPDLDTKALAGVGLGSKDIGLRVAVVRLHQLALFVYALRRVDGKVVESAWILCDQSVCAPLRAPELGKMTGYSGLVTSCLALMLAKAESAAPSDKDLLSTLERCLWGQKLAYERGLAKLVEDPPAASPGGSGPVFYSDHFAAYFRDTYAKLQPSASSSNENPCFQIKVDIKRAVAHRTQWFMARETRETPRCGEAISAWENSLILDKFADSSQSFYCYAMSWLCRGKAAGDLPTPIDHVPVVQIGKLSLVDRREVEDILAIYSAAQVYVQFPSEKRPLNIAVFGAPGSGKSFGIKEVMTYVAGETGGEIDTDILEYNLSQFTSLDDLAKAMHAIRNRCLKGKIPVVFFDEFDSTFQGVAFGWLKYFLAPMQDALFYHDGGNHSIGRAVFVFAGGVNRSFEEMNGRLRNPGFCEAKGPDFISRLKAHLNIQGINRPDDDNDQGRYLLRRGCLLRNKVMERMDLKVDKPCPRPLLHPSVARALLLVDRFKHGVRSIESIIKMCTLRDRHPLGPSDLPSKEQLEMHVDAASFLELVDGYKESPDPKS